jgi:hypothetical protein
MVEKTKRGLKSFFILKCNTCAMQETLETTRTGNSLNRGLVWATLSSGNGYAGVLEIMGLSGINFMSKTTFHALEAKMTRPINEVLQRTLKNNGREEFALAEAIDGYMKYRTTSVSYDMMLCQANKGRYNGPSGAVSISLFLDVTN